MKQDYRNIRREYNVGELSQNDLTEHPLHLFQHWLDDAVKADIADATAMSLATAAADGRPSARIVLLKQADEAGFSWFTDKRSHKGRDLAENPKAELLFYWRELGRQVRVFGRVEALSEGEEDKYFYSRPEASRFSAAASCQGAEIESRAVLEARVKVLREQYPAGDVPRPREWGGYRLIPEEYEFWQGRVSRLHDRFSYTQADDPSGLWVARRLSP